MRSARCRLTLPPYAYGRICGAAEMQPSENTSAAATVSWPILEWCKAIPMSRSKFYELPAHQRPTIVRLGKMQRIVEPPAAYMQRIAAAQAAPVGTDSLQSK